MPTTSGETQFHDDLLEHLEAVNQWWPDSSQPSVSAINAREVLVQLTELRDALKAQFAVEEEHGLLPDEPSVDPRYQANADALLKQHPGLLQRLDAVIVSIPVTSESSSAWATAKKHFDEFRQALLAHDRAEVEMVQAAFNDDFGVGD